MTEKVAPVKEPQTYGMLARFDSVPALMEAATKMRDAGYSRWDVHSPFPIHGMDKAMGLKRSPLGFIVGGVALCGFTAIASLQWWTSTIDYPLIISGKPFFSFQAYIPVAFAITVLSSAFGAFFGMMILNRLPMLYHPLFNSQQFKKVTDDGLFISVEAGDPKFDPQGTRRLLESIGGRDVEVITG